MFATLLLRRLVLLIVIFQLSAPASPALAGHSHRPFWVGYNEAWVNDLNYGNWLSSNPTFPQFNDSKFNETMSVLDRYFHAMKDGNANIVRIWLFPALQGIVIKPDGSAGPQTQGLAPDFLGNMETVLAHARAHRLKVYITLLNGVDMFNIYNEFDPEHPVPFVQMLITYFRNLLMNENSELDAFKANVLTPVLARLNHYDDVIYAVDLMNEIEGPGSVGYFPLIPDDAQAWIRDMAAFVKGKSPRLRVTSSAGFGVGVEEITMGLYSGLGLDFYDVHIYGDYGRYSGVAKLCKAVKAEGKQIVLGEFGQKTEQPDDLLQTLTTAGFLSGALRNCYSAALAWKFETTVQSWLSFVHDSDKYGRLRFRPAYYAVKAFGALGGVR